MFQAKNDDAEVKQKYIQKLICSRYAHLQITTSREVWRMLVICPATVTSTTKV